MFIWMNSRTGPEKLSPRTYTRARARAVFHVRRKVDLSRTRQREKLPSERFSSDVPLPPRLFSNVCLNLPLLPARSVETKVFRALRARRS